MQEKKNNNNKQKKINVAILDDIGFIALCATVFTSCFCHWILDIGYKYTFEDTHANWVDFQVVGSAAFVLMLYMLIRKQKIQFDLSLVILIQTMFLVAVLDYHNEEYSSVCMCWIIPLSYILGKLVVTSVETDINKRVYVLYGTMATSMFIIGCLDYAQVFGRYDGGAAWPSFWFEDYIVRTTYDFGFIPMIGALVIGFYLAHGKKILGIIIIGLCFIPVIFSVLFESRMAPCFIVLSLICGIVIYTYDNWNNTTFKKRIIKGVLFSFFTCAILIILFNLDILGIKTRYMSSYWGDDGGILKNARISIDWNGFKDILKHPFGDFRDEGIIKKSHTMLLEYGRSHGFAIWGLLAIVRIIMIKDAFILFKNKNACRNIRYLLIPAFICINMYYSMEPNGHQFKYFWMPGLFLSGMIRGWIENETCS